jgi:UDP-N-acetylmuramate--alanine ligase
MIELSKIKKAHFVGVGGAGVSAIARFFAQKGIAIYGSDLILPPRETLPAGEYFEGSQGSHVPPDASVAIYSPAVPPDDAEREAARHYDIPELSYPEALALVTRPFNTIAVSGTHGKSTTTALMGKLFNAGGFSPNVIVGAEVPGWTERNLLLGKGDIFIVEACEYRRHMMRLSPQAILLTNLELDHPDYYHDLADIKTAFREYIGKLTGEDLLIYNNDDANLREIAEDIDVIKVRFGIGSTGDPARDAPDLAARNVRQFETEQTFELIWKGGSLGEFTTPLPGLYNVYNILGAIATYLSYSGDPEKIKEMLTRFHGVGRRFEVLGEKDGTTIISDYAHHPTALSAVVSAARDRYPNKELLTVFRPHHKERTRKLFDEFVRTAEKIPHLVLTEIYDVAGRNDAEEPISSNDLVGAVLKRQPHADIVYAADLQDAERIVRGEIGRFGAVLVVGAGDADKLAKKLVQ